MTDEDMFAQLTVLQMVWLQQDVEERRIVRVLAENLRRARQTLGELEHISTDDN